MKTLWIVGLGTPGRCTVAAQEAVRHADRLFLQTAEHPSCRWIAEEGIAAETMDALYNEAEDFDELNEAIAERLLAEENGETVVYAAPGRGIEGTAQMSEILTLAKERGIKVRRIPGIGYADTALCEIDPFENSPVVCTAVEVTERSIDVSLPLVIEELDTVIKAGEVKLHLMEYYPEEWPVQLIYMNEGGEYQVKEFPLYELDRKRDFFAATVLALAPVPFTERERHGVEGLMQVLFDLRAPGGCPWDAEQTHESLKSSLLEETYEVLDAIEREDEDALCEELGDLLLQIGFHATIAGERCAFTLRDVTTGIVNKLIYRHPHVYKDARVRNSEDVLVNWESLKKKEKHFETQTEVLEAVPKNFPALIRAHKVQKKAAHVGFDWDDPSGALAKVREEADEVQEALANGTNLFEELGDLLFAAVNVSRLCGEEAEPALKAATDKFVRRFGAMEKLILENGRTLEGMSLEEMDNFWDEAKRREKCCENA